MHQRTDLSAGPINGSDRLSVELIEPADLPAVIAINWPAKPTLCMFSNVGAPVASSGHHTSELDQVAATAMRLLANATVELAAIKVWKRL